MPEIKNKTLCLSTLVYLCADDFGGLNYLHDPTPPNPKGWHAWSDIMVAPLKPLATFGHKTPELAVEKLLQMIVQFRVDESGICNHSEGVV